MPTTFFITLGLDETVAASAVAVVVYELKFIVFFRTADTEVSSTLIQTNDN